ncbi:MAG: sulfur carrier protein ThiS [Gemmatimonadota bacterium]
MNSNTAKLESSIRIQINGEAREMRAGMTITDLLSDLGLHPRLIVVEHNREILDRERYASTEVRAGDALELVHFVGGG